jgi:hypothetical protein
MSETYSKTLLRAFVDAFVTRSKSLGLSPFNRRNIAERAFAGNNRKNAKSRLSECCSPRSPRPLDARALATVLDACRESLRLQYVKLGDPDPDGKVSDDEGNVCRALRLTDSGRVHLDDFRLNRCLENAETVADIGLPDLIAWRDGSFGFSNELESIQARSIALLEELFPRIAAASSDEERLRFATVAVNVAMLNHPASRWHERAFDLALAGV